MRILCNDGVRGIALDVEHKLLLVDGPTDDATHGILLDHLSLLDQVYLLGLEEQFDGLVGGDRHGHGQRALVANL